MGVQLSCAPKADLKGQRELARRWRQAAKAKAKAHAVGGARVSASIEKHRDDLDVAQRTRAVQRRPAVLRAMAAWSDARGGLATSWRREAVWPRTHPIGLQLIVRIRALLE